MMNMEELRANRTIVNEIDWTMTPEKAIEMYLEWGSGWTRGNDFVSHHNQESIYFVLYDWDGPKVTLIKRSMAGAEEIAQISVPEDLFQAAWQEDGNRPGVGVHPLNRELQEWVRRAVDGPSIMHHALGRETVNQNLST